MDPPATACWRNAATVASRNVLIMFAPILSVNTAARFSPCAGVTSSQMAFARCAEYLISSPVMSDAALAAPCAAAWFCATNRRFKFRPRRFIFRRIIA